MRNGSIHDYFDAVLRKRWELWRERPVHLKLTTNEIKALSTEDRAQFWNEVDRWSVKAAEDMKDFLNSLGLP